MRGKLHKLNLRLISPARLDPEEVDFLVSRAEAPGIPFNALVNWLLKKDIELIKAAR